LAEAERLVQDGRFEAAGAVLRAQLARSDLAPPMRARLEGNLSAALCVLAQGETDKTVALDHLSEAQRFQIAALAQINRIDAPLAWAKGQVNLAIVHTSRHALTRQASDLFAAHLALDGAEAVFQKLGEVASLDWVGTLRDHLAALRRRR
jgi:hypothetical protein